MPPFYVVFTDNGMQFTMKYAHHSGRKTIFTKKVEQSGIIHALIERGKPWRNGFIERSNRTDKSEFFSRQQFTCSQQRQLAFRLWENHYNFHRPHMGIGLKTPADKFKELFPLEYSFLSTT